MLSCKDFVATDVDIPIIPMSHFCWSQADKTGPEVIKLFMLNSVEHEILNTYKYKNIKKFSFFLGSYKSRRLFFPLMNVKMPKIVGILTFMSRKKFILKLSMKKVL